MNRSPRSVFFVLPSAVAIAGVLLAAVLSAAPGPARPVLLGPDGRAPAAFVPGEVIVELHETQAAEAKKRAGARGRLDGARTGLPTFDAIAARHGVREIRALDAALQPWGRAGRASALARFFHLTLGEGRDVPAAVAEFRAHSAVRSAQPNFIYRPDRVPNDPLYPEQYAHQRTQAEAAWDITTGQDPQSRIVIAVLGTGVKLDHVDLAANIVPGYDFFGGDTDPSPGSPTESHETLVAGVAAAVTDNLEGVAGVCWGCGIMPLRLALVSDQVAAALDFATQNGARVANMSFSGPVSSTWGPDAAIGQAIDRAAAAGMVLVGSAGNTSLDDIRYPASDPDVIAVAATQSGDTRAGFSTFGFTVDVAAPGQDILTPSDFFPGYESVNGTSFSAPYVAGLAGLILSRNPALTPRDVRLILETTADRVPADHFIGSGRVNAGRAVAVDTPITPFAVIKSPEDRSIAGPGPVDVFGTALATDYHFVQHKPRDSAVWNLLTLGAEADNATLATLDTSGLAPGLHDLRLTAISDGNIREHQVGIYVPAGHPAQAGGWPVALQGELIAAPAFADLDGDGTTEIIAGTDLGWLYVLRHDGSLHGPGWPLRIRPRGLAVIEATPAVADLDGDGDLEIVVINSPDATLHVYNADGTSPWSGAWDVGRSTEDAIYGGVLLADIDADPALEIIAATDQGNIVAVNIEGSWVPGFPRNLGWPAATFASPAAGDIDGDGELEILVHGFSVWSPVQLYAFNADGTEAAGWPVPVGGGFSGPVLTDIDGDAAAEVIVSEASGIVIIRGDGQVIARTTAAGRFASNTAVALGDLNDDGLPEIYAGYWGGVYAFDLQGNVLAGWPAPTSGDALDSPVIADVDGDGQKDVMATGSHGRIHVWNAAGQHVEAAVLGAQVLAGAVAADLDGDGDVELIAGTRAPDLRVLDLPWTWNTARADWPLFQGDGRHTGTYRYLEASLTPRQLTAVVGSRNPNRIDLAWGAPVDEARVAGYDVLRDGALLAQIGPGTTYSDATAVIGTPYTYRVIGRDAAGRRSPVSNAATATIEYTCGTVTPACGNGTCEAYAGEDCLSCPSDCRGKQNGKSQFCCGDGGGTNPLPCSSTTCTTSGYSCTDAPVSFCCGNLVCETGETTTTCAEDCLVVCGDGLCHPLEDSCLCPGDCGAPPAQEAVCNDGLDNDCDGIVDRSDADCAPSTAHDDLVPTGNTLIGWTSKSGGPNWAEVDEGFNPPDDSVSYVSFATNSSLAVTDEYQVHWPENMDPLGHTTGIQVAVRNEVVGGLDRDVRQITVTLVVDGVDQGSVTQTRTTNGWLTQTFAASTWQNRSWSWTQVQYMRVRVTGSLVRGGKAHTITMRVSAVELRVDSQAVVDALVPSADVSTQWIPKTAGGPNWREVDEGIAATDDDGSEVHVSTTASALVTDEYGISDPLRMRVTDRTGEILVAVRRYGGFGSSSDTKEITVTLVVDGVEQGSASSLHIAQGWVEQVFYAPEWQNRAWTFDQVRDMRVRVTGRLVRAGMEHLVEMKVSAVEVRVGSHAP
jgi:thermitase